MGSAVAAALLRGAAVVIPSEVPDGMTTLATLVRENCTLLYAGAMPFSAMLCGMSAFFLCSGLAPARAAHSPLLYCQLCDHRPVCVLRTTIPTHIGYATCGGSRRFVFPGRHAHTQGAPERCSRVRHRSPSGPLQFPVSGHGLPPIVYSRHARCLQVCVHSNAGAAGWAGQDRER